MKYIFFVITLWLTFFLRRMTSLLLTSNEKRASCAPTYRVDPSLPSNSLVVLWLSGSLKTTSGLSAESAHKHSCCQTCDQSDHVTIIHFPCQLIGTGVLWTGQQGPWTGTSVYLFVSVVEKINFLILNLIWKENLLKFGPGSQIKRECGAHWFSLVHLCLLVGGSCCLLCLFSLYMWGHHFLKWSTRVPTTEPWGTPNSLTWKRKSDQFDT